MANGNAPALTGHEILALSFAVDVSSRRATLFKQFNWKPGTNVISRLIAPKFYFCSNPESRLDSDIAGGPFRANERLTSLFAVNRPGIAACLPRTRTFNIAIVALMRANCGAALHSSCLFSPAHKYFHSALDHNTVGWDNYPQYQAGGRAVPYAPLLNR